MKLLKKTIPVIVIVIAIITVFYINTPCKDPMAITSPSSSSSIFIEDVNINTDVAKAYKRNYETLPEELKEYVTSITITNKSLAEKFGLNLDAKIMAITYGTDIYVSDNSYDENVLIHELFHAYDYSKNWISKTAEFTSIYEAEKDFVKVSDGNVQNVHEFFASAGQMYYFDKDQLKEIAPLTYEFMANHFSF